MIIPIDKMSGHVNKMISRFSGLQQEILPIAIEYPEKTQFQTDLFTKMKVISFEIFYRNLKHKIIIRILERKITTVSF